LERSNARCGTEDGEDVIARRARTRGSRVDVEYPLRGTRLAGAGAPFPEQYLLGILTTVVGCTPRRNMEAATCSETTLRCAWDRERTLMRRGVLELELTGSVGGGRDPR